MFKLCLWGISFTQVLFYLTATEVFYSLLIMPFVIGLMMKFVQNFISTFQPIWVDMLFYVFTDHLSHVFYFQMWRIERYLMIRKWHRCRLCNPNVKCSSSFQWRCCLMAIQSCFEPGFYIFEPFCDEDLT